MSFTYDPTTDRGKVRLLIGDTDDVTPSKQVYDDDEVDAFLTLADLEGGQRVFRGAAIALRAIAGNEIQVLKVITNLDLKTNGASVGDALRRLADSYDDKAEHAGGPGALFDTAVMIETDSQWRERVFKEAHRTT